MTQQLTSYRIFIASPGGLADERNEFNLSVALFNETDAYERGIHFKAVGWQETLAGHGRPQELINQDLRNCDLFILILHDRWGSPPSNDAKYTSGTEEEFQEAFSALKDDEKPMFDMILLFKEVSRAQLADPGIQLSQVLAFKKEREEKKDFLYKTFNTLEELTKILQFCFSNWVRKHETNGVIKKRRNQKKLTQTINTQFELSGNNWLHEIISNDNWELALIKADICFKEGKIVEADMLYSQIYLRSNDPKHIAEYGKYLRKQFRLFAAEEVLKKSISMSESSNNLSCQAYSQRQLGRVFEFKGELNKALLEFQKALDIFVVLNDQNGEARTLMDIGFALSKNNNSKLGISELNKAIEIYKMLKDNIGLGAAYGYLGVIYKDKGDIDKSEEFSKMALKLFSEAKKINDSEVAIIKGNLGVIKRIKKEYLESEKYHNEALAYFAKSNDTRAKAREYCNLGVVYRLSKKYDEAIQMHEKALEYEEKTLNIKGKGIQLANIGLNLIEKQEFDRAEIFLKDALSINVKLCDEKSMTIQYRNIAKLHLAKSEYELGIISAEKALQIDTKCDNKIGIAESKVLLADINSKSGPNKQICKDLYEAALSIYKKYNHVSMIVILEEKIKNCGPKKAHK